MIHHFLQFAVLGSAAVDQSGPVLSKVRRLGEAMARHNAAILTGGCPGLPYEASRSAARHGGLTVAISPAMNLEEHTIGYGYPGDFHLWIFTGMGKKGRNVILVRSGQACVFVGGGLGALNEFTIACAELPPHAAIGLLTGTGGVADFAERVLEVIDGRPVPAMFSNESPDDLVGEMVRHINKRSKKPAI